MIKKNSLILSAILLLAACITSRPPDCLPPATDKITYEALFGEDPQPKKSPPKNPYLDPNLPVGEDNNPKLDAVARVIIETLRLPYFTDRVGFMPVGKGFDLTEDEARNLSLIGGKGPVGRVVVLSETYEPVPGEFGFDFMIKFRGVSRDSEEGENRVLVYMTFYSSFWDR